MLCFLVIPLLLSIRHVDGETNFFWEYNNNSECKEDTLDLNWKSQNAESTRGFKCVGRPQVDCPICRMGVECSHWCSTPRDIKSELQEKLDEITVKIATSNERCEQW